MMGEYAITVKSSLFGRMGMFWVESVISYMGNERIINYPLLLKH